VTSFVYKSNKRARKLNEGLGFVQEGKHRDAGKNLEPIFSYGLTRRDFVEKYLKRVRHGIQETASPTPSP
jgi:RimJ/RimL family protein N-acetyltransferase